MLLKILRLKQRLTSIYSQTLVIPSIRKFVGRVRLFYFFEIKKRWQIVSSEDAFNNTNKHNLKSLKNFDMYSRMDLIIKPISVLEFLDNNSKILVIGPRNEGDLLSLIGHGFPEKNIRGLDLMSYSPLIDVGDMHQTHYEDNEFDVIISGYTLGYSKDPKKWVQESIRIAKSGAVFGVAVEYSNMTSEDIKKLCGYEIVENGHQECNSVKEIIDLFDGYVDHVYFSHDAPSKRSHTSEGLVDKPSRICVIFTVKK